MFNKRKIPSVESPSKRAKLPDWQLHLREHGYTVIPNVLDAGQVDSYSARFWDWIESFKTGIDRNNRETWKTANWPPSIRGLIQHYKIGHAKFVWDLRTEQAIINIFAQLWGTDDLLVSFDGACLAKPSHKEVEMQTDSWAHIDQGPRKAGKYECVQGLVTLSEAGPGLGGLVVYSGSHKLHKRFFERFPKFAKKVGSGDWAKLEPRHRQWFFKHGAEEVQPAGPPGSLILWDSRTVHWAARPAKHMSHCRMAVYLCYVPRSKATERDLEKKRKAFKERRMTSHWPANPKLFPKAPRTYGDDELLKKFTDRETIADDEVTEEIAKLAGFQRKI